jgi:hypothetical protein
MTKFRNDILFASGFACLEVGVAQQYGGPVAWMTAGVVMLAVSLFAAVKSTRPPKNVH